MKRSFRRDPLNKANSLVNYKIPNTSKGRVFTWCSISLPSSIAWEVLTKHKQFGYDTVSAMVMDRYHKPKPKSNVINMFGNRLTAA